MRLMSNFWRMIIEAIVRVVLDYLEKRNKK